MKAECLLDKLKIVVSQIEKVSGKNLSLPILGSICIQTDDSGLIFKATNLNIGAEIRVPAKVLEHGTIAVNASLFAQICNGLIGDTPVNIETSNENLVLQTKSSKMTLKSLNADDFPNLPRIESGETFELSIDQFISGIKAVAFSAAMSDIKPEISSIYIYQNNQHLIFVATDAFRLAEKRIPIKGLAQFPEILLPIKNIPEIVRILSEYQGVFKITIGENQISFNNSTVFITSRLTGGSYPNYKQIMPTGSKTELVVLKNDFQSVLKSLFVFSDKLNQIDLTINPSEKKCTLVSQNNDTGEGIVSFDAVITGEALEIRMNHRYISEAMGSFNTDSLSFSFTEPNRPMIVKGVGDDSFTYLVMPMNR